MTRPLGVSVLAILNWLTAMLDIVFTLVRVIRMYAHGALEEWTAADNVSFAFSLFGVFVGFGLWKLRPWARSFMIWIALLSIPLGICIMVLGDDLLSFSIALLLSVAEYVILRYLLLPHVRRAFELGGE